ncbi:MAG TPA: hypothetical protein VF633_01380, partial [Brevundimonas sp.]
MINRSRLAALLTGTALMFAAGAVQAQQPEPLPAEVLVDAPDAAKAAFLKDHVVVSGPVSGGLTFAFPPAFYDNKLFLLGESHGVAAPQVLDLELLTHLNARIGLIDYVAEVDPVQGLRLNQYLDSGDEAVLDRVFDYWTRTGAQWGNTAFEDKIRGIRALNLTLPENRRVHLLGIDAVQDWPLTTAWLAEQGLTVDPAALSAATTNAARATVVLAALPTTSTSPVL